MVGQPEHWSASLEVASCNMLTMTLTGTSPSLRKHGLALHLWRRGWIGSYWRFYTVCKPESWECAQLIRIDSCTRSSTRRLSDKTRGGGSEGGREGKGHVSYAALFLPLPLSPPPPRIRRTYFGRHASEPEIRTACAAYSLLASQHLDPLPLGNIILSALQKDGERGTKLQPIAFCYGIE